MQFNVIDAVDNIAGTTMTRTSAPLESASTTLVPDILTCGRCRRNFPLNEFISFLWHKVLGCGDESTVDENDTENMNDQDEFEDSPSRTPSTSSVGELLDSPPVVGTRRFHRDASRSVDNSRGRFDTDTENADDERRKSRNKNTREPTGMPWSSA